MHDAYRLVKRFVNKQVVNKMSYVTLISVAGVTVSVVPQEAHLYDDDTQNRRKTSSVKTTKL